jgi:hypothetical protein
MAVLGRRSSQSHTDLVLGTGQVLLSEFPTLLDIEILDLYFRSCMVALVVTTKTTFLDPSLHGWKVPVRLADVYPSMVMIKLKMIAHCVCKMGEVCRRIA